MTRTINCRNHRLSELFYSDLSVRRGAELKKGLEEYQFFLATACLAINHLKDLELEEFDAIVGENACQIRAVKIALIAKSYNQFNIQHLLEKITETEKILNELLTPSVIHKILRSRVSLTEVFEQHDLEVSLTSDELFAIQSYLLCKMRVDLSGEEVLQSIQGVDKCSPAPLKNEFSQLSISFITKLGDHLRRLLSKASVDFVREVALELEDPILTKMVGEEFEVSHNRLTCTPTFWAFKALFNFTLKAQIPLVLHAKFLEETEGGYKIIDEDLLYFKPCHASGSYIDVDLKELDSNTPICMIQGALRLPQKISSFSKETWQQDIKDRTIMDILLAASADHRQYPNPEQHLNIKDAEYEHFKSVAEKEGFALHNPTTFFVRHIYSSTTSNKLILDSESLLESAQVS